VRFHLQRQEVPAFSCCSVYMTDQEIPVASSPIKCDASQFLVAIEKAFYLPDASFLTVEKQSHLVKGISPRLDVTAGISTICLAISTWVGSTFPRFTTDFLLLTERPSCVLRKHQHFHFSCVVFESIWSQSLSLLSSVNILSYHYSSTPS